MKPFFRAGLVRSACEVNGTSRQQHEPTESISCKRELVGIPCIHAGEEVNYGINMIKKYSRAPLPFIGQKRNFLKEFSAIIQDMPAESVYLDVFGGSGLLAHTAKYQHPDSIVIWNDFDDYQAKLDTIADVNALKNRLHSIFPDIKKGSALNEEEAKRLRRVYAEVPENLQWTFVSWFAFSSRIGRENMNDTNSYWFNLPCGDYSAAGYLEGVERIRADFREVIPQIYDYEREKMNIICDAHSCVSLLPQTDLRCLQRHRAAGFHYLSLNVGMDMNPVSDILRILASFRRQIRENAQLCLAQTPADIRAAALSQQLALSFDLEGSLPLLNDPDMIEVYRQLGVRQIHLAYNRNNSAAGGAHDDDRGLSALGRRMVAAVHRYHVLMDVSHSGYRTSMEVFECSAGHPVLYSHANPSALFRHGRNISDEQIKACAATGGLIAANGVLRFLGDPDLQNCARALAEHIDYMVQLVGSRHVGIGLDYLYDGEDDRPAGLNPRYWWPPAAGYDPHKGLSGRYCPPEILQETLGYLRQKGYSAEDLANIAGNNLMRLIEKVWSID